MSGNRAAYQTNEPNECAQCVWLWKIGHTNITGKACSAAIRMIFRREFSVPKVCSVCLIQATHACHSEVLTRFFGLRSPKKRFGYLWHFSARRPQPRSNEEFQPFSCPTRSLRSLTAAADFTSSALWLHNACKRQKIELWYARLGLQDIDCDLGCLIYETAASQWRNVEIQLVASVGWKHGCQPFGCLCSQSRIHSHHSFWNSKDPLPARSFRFPRTAAHSTSPALWLHHAPPFVGAGQKHLSHAKQRVSSRSCRLQDLLCTLQWLCQRFGGQDRILIALSVMTCDYCKSMKNCWDWVSSHGGLDVGLPAF